MDNLTPNTPEAQAAETKVLPRAHAKNPLYPIPAGWRVLAIGETVLPNDVVVIDTAREFKTDRVTCDPGWVVASDDCNFHFFFRRIDPAPQAHESAVHAAMDELAKMEPEELDRRINDAVGVLAPAAPEGSRQKAPAPSLHVLLNNLQTAAVRESNCEGPNSRRYANMLDIARAEIEERVSTLSTQVAAARGALAEIRAIYEKWANHDSCEANDEMGDIDDVAERALALMDEKTLGGAA